MMRKRAVQLCLFVLTSFFMGMFSQAFGDSAEVLPKGVFRIDVDTEYYFPISKRFDPEGKTEDVSHDFNAVLNSNVFPALSGLDNILGGPGSAVIGTSNVSFKYEATDVIMKLMYGVTDRLSAGVQIPYYWRKTKVNQASVNTSNATVGKNPLFGTPADPFHGAPIVPIAVGGVPLTTQDVQNLLGPGLTINGQLAIPGFGYKPIETWSGSGIGDMEAGFRYQYLKNDNWRLAFMGGVRFPTGKVDDPDNLIDLGFGTDAYAALFRINNDYTGIKNLVLDATLKYDLYFPETLTKRVPNSVNNPIAPLEDKVKVNRNLGNVFEFEGSAKYQFYEGWDFELMYNYVTKTQDSVTGSANLSYLSLEQETDWTYNRIYASLSYSTLPLFMAKKFPLPLSVSVAYENVFAGSNNFLKQQGVYLKLVAFF